MKAWEVLDSIIGKYISMKRDEMKSRNNEKCAADLPKSYISTEEIENQDLKRDNKFLRDTILNLMIAGRDTTSSGLKWFLWLVSTHPEVERKIRDEPLSAIPAEEAKKLRVFQIQELGKLVYLHAAMCESLRLFNPPVPFQHKEPLQAGILPGGHFVHSKLKVMFSLYAIWSQYGERIASNSSQKDGFPSVRRTNTSPHTSGFLTDEDSCCYYNP